MITNHGKNIDPHEIEEVVNRFGAGRSVCLGTEDGPLILFEPENPSNKELLGHAIQEEVGRRFDLRCRVEAVPGKWLTNKPDGKIARRANLERYRLAKDRRIYVVGDSHVRMLWTEDDSNVHARWIGDFWSRDAHRFDEIMLDLLSRLERNDILVIEAGEPECRVVFPGAENAVKAIDEAVADYEEYFRWIRKRWNGRLGYMTGAPTNATVLGPVKHDRVRRTYRWEQPCGTPMLRYACQERFYALMKELCTRLDLAFIDACTPFLQEGPYLDEKYLDPKDGVHIDRKYQRRYFDWLDRHFGFVRTRPKNITFPLDNRASEL